MSHHHHHHQVGRKIGIAFFLNLGFTIIELIGGLLTNSLAVLSDAIHDLGDCMSLGLAWYFERLSGRQKDTDFSFGYRRFSILGATVTSSILMIGSVIIIYRAIPRIISPEVTDGLGMLGLAVIGILFNGLAAWQLHGSESLNERTVFLHLLEDVLGWVAILIGGACIYLWGWYIIDPILSVVIAIFVLYNAFKNLMESSKIILQRIPKDFDLVELEHLLASQKGVHGVHDVHLWTMDGQYHILSAHVVVDANSHLSKDLQGIKECIKLELHKRGISHATLEFETPEENCGDFIDC